MAPFLYRTRGNSNPQGKPRVYFCCHPEDFPKYFDSVAQEILKKQNCALWYPEDPHIARDSAFLSDLEQMQLFVMPVTAKLLHTENSVLDTEFPFAMAHHIPVLPLMQEGGLEKLFNEKCGDLQFLDKNLRDDTAIDYGRKLETFLSSVLVGDQLAEKIRSAFDAYVFLSYRKKDRRHAQELMRLIHKNDFARDIAIWYDEFLTPGENFNDSIKEALDKSSLFVLAVTPNLVNESNYIQTTEYPMAKSAGKPILPAELVATEQQLLAEQYRGIPQCVDAHDDSAFSQALLTAIRSLAIRENDGSPEHTFFIGLAYLSGVDVEVDHARALALITSAAQAGLPEALEKLVEMYRGGIGVARSYETAIAWQEKRITLAEQAFAKETVAGNLKTLLSALLDCGDYYGQLHSYGLAREKHIQGIRSIEKVRNWQDYPAFTRYRFLFYSRLGDLYRAEKNAAAAAQAYGEAMECARKLADLKQTPDTLRNLAVGYSRLGDLCRDEGKLSDAKAYYLRSLELSQTVVKTVDNPTSRTDISVCCNRLGDLACAEGDFSLAREYYEKALAIDIQAAQEAGTPEARRLLAVSYHRLGDISRQEGKFSAAEEYYLQALEISARNAEETDTLEAHRDQSAGYIKLGFLHKDQGQLPSAEGAFLKALSIIENIAAEAPSVEAQRDRSVCHLELGGIYKGAGLLQPAKDHYQKALVIDLALAESTGTLEAKRDLSLCYDKLGNLCKTENDFPAAKEYFQKGLELCHQIAQQTGTLEAKRDLFVSYVSLGDLCNRQKELSAALDYFKKAASISTELAKATGTADAFRDLAMCYKSMGDIYFSAHHDDAAAVYYREAVSLCERVVGTSKTVASYEALAMAYYHYSLVLTQEKTLYLQKAVNLFGQLAQACPNVARYRQYYQALKDKL